MLSNDTSKLLLLQGFIFIFCNNFIILLFWFVFVLSALRSYVEFITCNWMFDEPNNFDWIELLAYNSTHSTQYKCLVQFRPLELVMLVLVICNNFECIRVCVSKCMLLHVKKKGLCPSNFLGWKECPYFGWFIRMSVCWFACLFSLLIVD